LEEVGQVRQRGDLHDLERVNRGIWGSYVLRFVFYEALFNDVLFLGSFREFYELMQLEFYFY
jgi:hypothetical protein